MGVVGGEIGQKYQVGRVFRTGPEGLSCLSSAVTVGAQQPGFWNEHGAAGGIPERDGEYPGSHQFLRKKIAASVTRRRGCC